MPYADRPVGIFGVAAAVFSVIEVQARLALHSHMIIWGNIPSRMLTTAAMHADLKRAVCKVFDSQLCAHLPVEQHLAGLLQRVENRGNPHKTRYTYEICPLPSQDPAQFSKRVYDIHDATSIHEHSKTCHKGNPDISCRLCYERSLRPTTSVEQLTPNDKDSGFDPTSHINKADPSMLFCRDRRHYPLPNIDARALVWEIARPETPFSYLETLAAEMHLTPGTADVVELMRRFNAISGDDADKLKEHIKQIVSARNMATVEISPVATALLACNTAAVLLGCSESCKSTLFYLLKYITKDSTSLGHSLTILHDAVNEYEMTKEQTDRKERICIIDESLNRQAEYPSVAADTGTDSRTGKHLLAIMVNKLNGMSEYADTQVASCNLGNRAYTSSDSFTFVFVLDYVAAVKSRLPVPDETVKPLPTLSGCDDDSVSDVTDDDDDYDLAFGEGIYAVTIAPDQSVSAATGSRYHIEDLETGTDEIVVVTQEDNYRWRGLHLTELNAYQYPCMIEIVKRRKDTDVELELTAESAYKGVADVADIHDLFDIPDDDDDDDVTCEDVTIKTTAKAKRRDVFTRFNFHENHPLYRTHQQQVRGRFYCPILAGGPPPSYPITHRNCRDGDNVDTMKCRFAMYILTLFSPWTNEGVPRDGTTWDNFCTFMAKLDGIDITTGVRVATTFEQRVIFETIENIARTMSPPIPELKRWTIKHRARGTVAWDRKANTPCTFDSYLRDILKIKSPAATDATTVRNDDSQNNIDHKRAEDAVAMMQARTETSGGDKFRQQKLEEDAAACLAYSERTKSALNFAFDPPHVLTRAVHHAAGVGTGVVLDSVKMCELALKRLRCDAPAAIPTALDAVRSGFEDGGTTSRNSSMNKVPLKTLAVTYVNEMLVADRAKNIKGVTVDQKAALMKFAVYCDAFYNYKVGGYKKPDPLKLLLLGGPGVGKSFLIGELRAIMEKTTINSVSCAYTGCAASVLDKARTISSLFSVGVPESNFSNTNTNKHNSNISIPELKADKLTQLRHRLNEAHVVIIDEVSMIGAALLGKLHARLCQVATTENDRTMDFGGHCMVMVGDFYQIPPVGDHCLVNAIMDTFVYETQETKNRSPASPSAIGARLFRSFDLTQLVTQVRAASDPRHAEFLNQMRSATLGMQAVSDELIECLLNKKLSAADTVCDYALAKKDLHESWALAPVLVVTNAEREFMLEQQSIRAATLLGVPVLKWRLQLKTTWYNSKELDTLYSGTPGAWAYFVEGSFAFVTENLNPLKGVANGTRVVMHSLVFRPKDTAAVRKMIASASAGDVIDLGNICPLYINVKLPTSDADANSWPKDETVVKGEVVIPVGLSRYSRNTVNLAKVGRFVNPQNDVRLAKVHAVECGFALTFHKVQGKTLPKVILELAERPCKTGKGNLDFHGLLVALSRVKNTNDLRIIDAPDDQFDYLRRIRAPQSLLLWLEGFHDSTGLWDIDKCRSAVEQAIKDDLFVDGSGGKKMQNQYLSACMYQKKIDAKQREQKTDLKTGPPNRKLISTSERAKMPPKQNKPDLKTGPPNGKLAVSTSERAKMAPKQNLVPMSKRGPTILKPKQNVSVPVVPAVVPSTAISVILSKSITKRKDMVSDRASDSIAKRMNMVPSGVGIPRIDAKDTSKCNVVSRPPCRHVAYMSLCYDLTAAQCTNATKFLNTCLHTSLTTTEGRSGDDPVLPTVLSTIFHPGSNSTGTLDASYTDLCTLMGRRYVDGAAISGFMHLQVLKRALCTGPDRVHRVTVFDSQFYVTLRDGPDDNLIKADRMVAAMCVDHVLNQVTVDEALSGDLLFPLFHAENHWLLVIIPLSVSTTIQRVVYVLDPYGTEHSSHFHLIATWLRQAHPADTRPIVPIYKVRDVPIQRDGYSCGVYVSAFAYCWIWSGTLPTKKEFWDAKAPAFRLFMAHSFFEASVGSIEEALKNYIHPTTNVPEDLYTPRLGGSNDTAITPVLPRTFHVVLCAVDYSDSVYAVAASAIITVPVSKKDYTLSEVDRRAATVALADAARLLVDTGSFFPKISCRGRFLSCYQDFKSLKGREWLTGILIDDFLFLENLIPRLVLPPDSAVRPVNCRPNVVVFSSQFFNALNNGMYTDENKVDTMMRYLETQGRTFFASTTEIIMPVHVNGNHWLLVVIIFSCRTLYLLNPYHIVAPCVPVSTLLLKWLSRVMPDVISSSWNVRYTAATLPKQHKDDATSCGIFVTMYAYYWSLYRRFPDDKDFTQDDVPALRLFIASRLLSFQTNGLLVSLGHLSLRSDFSDLPLSLLELFLPVSPSLCHAGRVGYAPNVVSFIVRSPLQSTFFSPSQEPVRKICRVHITPVRNSAALTLPAVDLSLTAINVQAGAAPLSTSPVRRMLSFGALQ